MPAVSPAVLLGASVGCTLAVEPTPRALPLELVGNKGANTVIPLRASVPIPDHGELNWPIDGDATVGTPVKVRCCSLPLYLFPSYARWWGEWTAGWCRCPRGVHLLLLLWLPVVGVVCRA